MLGQVYEFFLGKFANSEGKNGGQFYTPESIVKTIVQCLEPTKGRVYDPACGSGGMFVQSEKFIENHRGRIGDISVFGQESNGTAGIVLANGSLSSNTSNEGIIRKNMIEDDLVDCVVALPDKLFLTTGIPACIWFLNRNKSNSKHRERDGEILFIDARKLGSLVERSLREFSAEDIQKIADTYHQWRGSYKGDGEYADIQGFCKSATLEEVKGHEYILTPG
ncbi:MAG: N-6 DNA methylase, partial [Fusobacteriaceae bacterium]